jgi:hypothetical protein
MNDRKISSRLLQADVAISNAMEHEEVKQLLAGYGYEEMVLQQGKDLQADASGKQQVKVKEYAEKEDSTGALGNAFVKASETYMQHVKIARIAFKNDVKLYSALMLAGNRKQSYTGWMEQADMFYSQALRSDEAKAGLARFGITEAKLLAAQAQADEVRNLLKAQKTEDAEAQDATQERDKALDKLDEWFGDFKQIARIALAGHPQYLEMLGIVEPS